MNYQDLEAKFKLSKDKLNKLLKAAEIGSDLADYSPHVQKLEGILTVAGDSQDYEGAAKKYKESHAIKAKAESSMKVDRPLPSFPATETGLKTVAKVDLTGIPVDDGVAKTWDEVAKVGAASDADTLAGAPFDGIIEGSDYVNDKAEALKQHGFNLYMDKFDEAMHDPELAKRVEDKYLGKFPARWNLKPKS
jgi:hypothetical protein